MRERVAWGALLVVLTGLAHAPAYGAAFVWDDDQYVTENAALGSLDGLRRIWLEPRATPQYYPLVHTTFWVEHALWGLEPAGYHAVNVVLHAGAALLLWALLARLGLPGAWLAAVAFALHPVAVESVAWVTERKNTLSGVFYFGAALVLAPLFDLAPGRAASGGEDGAGGEGEVDGLGADPPPASWRRYAAGGLLFLGALLSKTVTCSLPAALLVLCWWRRGRLRRREVGLAAPLLALGLAAGLHTAHLERVHVGAELPIYDLSIGERVLVAGRAAWFYAGKLLWPADLSFVYPRWRIDPGDWTQWLYPAAAGALLVVLFALRRRIGRGPLAAALIFGGTLTPALGFFPVWPHRYAWVADHFQYHASAAAIAALVAAAAGALARRSQTARFAGGVGAAVALVVLSGLTFARAAVYRDVEVLWRDAIAKNPTGFLPRNNLAVELVRQAALHRGLGQEEAAAVHLREARLHAERALAGVLDDHDRKIARRTAAVVALREGDPARALGHARAAVALDDGWSDAQVTLAQAERACGHTAPARARLEAVVADVPEHVLGRLELARLLLDGDDPRPEAAREHAEVAVARTRRRNPLALESLAEACHRTGASGRAAALAREAAALAEVSVRYRARAPELRAAADRYDAAATAR